MPKFKFHVNDLNILVPENTSQTTYTTNKQAIHIEFINHWGRKPHLVRRDFGGLNGIFYLNITVFLPNLTASSIRVFGSDLFLLKTQ